MNRFSKHKINKETVALKDTLDQMNLTDALRTFHSKTQEYNSSQDHMEHSPE